MSERLASTFRKGEFTNPHNTVLRVLSEQGIFYKAEEVVHCWGEFDEKGRPVSYKCDIVIVDPRYGGGVIEVDGGSHRNKETKDARKDTRLMKMGLWVERVPNEDAKNVMLYLEKHLNPDIKMGDFP